MAFSLTAKWCKGDTNKAPDALSHYAVWEPQQADALAEYDEENLPELSAAEIRAIVSEDAQDNIQVQELRDQANRNETYKQLKARILNGFLTTRTSSQRH